MTPFQWGVLIVGGITTGFMIYKYGWLEGRDSIRRELRAQESRRKG